MPYVKIEPRDECISDGVCIAICPDVFEWGEDGKATIVADLRVKEEEGMVAGKFAEDLLDSVQQAVDSCPVNIIHIVEEL